MGIKQIIPICISLIFTGVCLFATAGTLHWTNAWILMSLSLVTGLAFTAGRNAELDAERRNLKAGQSRDKLLTGITVLLGPMALWITAGLNHRFHGPSGIAPEAFYAAILAAIAGAALTTWAMRANRFFSAVVRIQKERGHVVIDHGPYAIVRHPGYTGMALFTMATPLILDSGWALLPAAATVCVMVLRTLLEDRTLQQELAGYTDYTRRVRARLVPFIW